MARPRTTERPTNYRRTRVVNYVRQLEHRVKLMGQKADPKEQAKAEALNGVVTEMMVEFNIGWEEMT